MKTEPIITVKNVTHAYNDTAVLENISFSVEQGEYLGIIGPNGGGKTTLLKIILGLEKPDAGEVLLFGKHPHALRNRTQVGYVPQRVSEALFNFPVTVQEVIETGVQKGHEGSEVDKVAPEGRSIEVGRPCLGTASRLGVTSPRLSLTEKALEICEISHLKNRLIGNLSGGERQRVFIARALASKPKILALDEPVAGVDLTSQEQFYLLLRNLNKEHGITILFVSHDIDVIANEVTNVLCLNRSLVSHGTPESSLQEENLRQLYGRKVKFVYHNHKS